MGNQAAKVTSAAAENVRKRMTIRRRRPENESEFSATEIQIKFNNIPSLTDEEKAVLKSSWAIIQNKMDMVK